MPFGSNSPKFALGRVGFDQGLGGPMAGGMVPNEMVTYPAEEVCEWWCGVRECVCATVAKTLTFLMDRMVVVLPF